MRTCTESHREQFATSGVGAPSKTQHAIYGQKRKALLRGQKKHRYLLYSSQFHTNGLSISDVNCIQTMKEMNFRRPGRPKGAKDRQARKKCVSLGHSASVIEITEIQGVQIPVHDCYALKPHESEPGPALQTNYFIEPRKNERKLRSKREKNHNPRDFIDPFHDDWPHW